MTDTTGLPPGCKPLHVTDDPKTWGNKRMVNTRGRVVPADVVFVGKKSLLVVEPTETETSWWFDHDGSYLYGNASPLRLYDAAPEPVKPREYFFVRRIESGEICSNLMADKAVAETRLRTDFMNPRNYEVVHLGELPLEAPEDQA